MGKLISKNPFTEEINAEFETISREELSAKIDLANEKYKTWKNLDSKKRKELFLKLADLIEKNHLELAKLETIEMGRLYKDATKGLIGTANLIKWFAENFERILGKQEFQTSEGIKGHFQYDSIGVIYGVAPWNFPFNQLLRAAVPNLLAGNTVVYKHASNVPLSAKKIEELFLEAGFEKGVYQNLFISSSDSEYIMSRKEIKGMNLTGSEDAGSAMGALAGKYLKPSVLELGGNDAFIVLENSNLEEIVKNAVAGRIGNAGQRCNSSKRFVILEKYYDEFCRIFVEQTKNLKLGDPFDESVDLGPLAKESSVTDIHNQVTKTISEGGKLLYGGEPYKINGKGYFYLPTVIADVTPEMTTYNEEVFGPVASIIKAKDIEDAIRIANDSDFGLCGVVFGDNFEECKYVAEKIETGMMFINQLASSKASLPFGGVKKSGYGKENGEEGLKAFTNKKVVVY